MKLNSWQSATTTTSSFSNCQADGEILRIDLRNPSLQVAIQGLRRPQAIAFDKYDNLVVATFSHQIHFFSRNDVYTKTYLKPVHIYRLMHSSFPAAMCFNADKSQLLIALTYKYCIVRLSMDASIDRAYERMVTEAEEREAGGVGEPKVTEQEYENWLKNSYVQDLCSTTIVAGRQQPGCEDGTLLHAEFHITGCLVPYPYAPDVYYSTDLHHNKIRKIDFAKNQVTTLIAGKQKTKTFFGEPHTLCFVSPTTMIFTDRTSNMLHKINIADRKIKQWAGHFAQQDETDVLFHLSRVPFYQPRAIVNDAVNRCLYVAYQKCVYKIEADF